MKKAKVKTLGEYGRYGGKTVVEVILVRGYTSEIRKLWKDLDSADGVVEEEIFRRLEKIGAVRTAS